MQTPGPGNYNITSWRSWPTPSYTRPVVVCFFKGADTCSSCETLLYGDYYQNSSGKINICFDCFRNIYDPIRRKPGNFHKMRHCRSYHTHIDVENIVHHKTTSKKIRRLQLMEKRMWNKFGESLDYRGKPI
ncbi:uncharacterized protein LOC118436655 [Folsomia candida]|uniref:uncharacterized protein LOC118436655 n=1 Tax=Folsomia candida TaxID=158441 RepID=UPI001604D922|nr:uncharacterized protein LOC118436655 [Folsomia candida]